MAEEQSGERKILSVTELNGYIQGLLETNPSLKSFYLRGEISNYKRHYSGHLYLSLKDSGSVVGAIMFKSSAAKLAFEPYNGLGVIVRCRVSLYVPSGQHRVIIEHMTPDGVGELYIAYEQLRKKLEAEGLFSRPKKPLPKIPRRVGVVTSPTGAVIHDIRNVSGRRFPFAEIVLYPAAVQGADAAPSLVAGLDYFNKTRSVDVIIIGRGGGSIEDLWAFNDETLARAVAASQIPVISAVGHESDVTICDFVADRRAPTPSAAAELALPKTEDLKEKMNNVVRVMQTLLGKRTEVCRQRLDALSAVRELQNPQHLIDDKREQTDRTADLLISAVDARLRAERARFAAQTGRLEALNPMAVIARGYSAVFREDGSLVKSVSQLSAGDGFTFRTTDGEIDGTVRTVRPSKQADTDGKE